MTGSKKRWAGAVLLIMPLLVALSPPSLVAQESVTDVATLLARIEQLERTVRVLELRIAALEGVAPATPVGLANWRQLRRKMKMDEVRELLGEPGHVEANSSYITWMYGNRGRVEFDADSERVTGWSEAHP